MLLVGTSGLMYSCKDDGMESITLKRSGNLKVVIKNGETPVASTQITFYNADTENELDIVTTDEQGVIDFGKLNEGNYGISFETSEPYSRINQELQVVSGENKEYTVQVEHYVGDLTLFLRDNNSGDLIAEDLKVGVAIVPDNNDFEKAFTNEEVIALATEMKYFGAEGKVFFENIPTGTYKLFQVVGDTIIGSEGNVYVGRANEEINSLYVDANIERLFNSEIWTVTKAIDYNSNEAISEFPLESMVFSRDLNGNFYHKMQLADGTIVEGVLSYNGAGYFYIYNDGSTSEDIDVNWSINSFRFDENGHMKLRFNSLSIYNYETNVYDFSDSYIEITLE